MPTFLDASVTAAFVRGWLLGASLIAAIGAQNALVLRQGLLRQHVGPVIALCIVSDWLLIAAGVYGVGVLITSSPVLLAVLRYGGAAFLAAYGLRATWRAWRGAALVAAPDGGRALGATLAAAAAMTWLNPHVYLDTVVLLGTLGAQHEGAARAAFVGGAGVASLMWFTLIGYGAAALAQPLQRPSVWRVIDASIAAVMFAIAFQLATG